MKAAVVSSLEHDLLWITWSLNDNMMLRRTNEFVYAALT
jgi:hypothetical protein